MIHYAQTKVWFNSDLRNYILSFLDTKPIYSCYICNKLLRHTRFVWDIQYEYYIKYDISPCKKRYFCSKECIKLFYINSDNKKCVIIGLLTPIFVMFFIIMILYNII
jgi:hypothetical protein